MINSFVMLTVFKQTAVVDKCIYTPLVETEDKLAVTINHT